MYRMAIISMLFESSHFDASGENESKNDDNVMRSNLDIGKMIQMSLIHDMAECVIGDITPHDRICSDKKHQSELSVMENLGYLEF